MNFRIIFFIGLLYIFHLLESCGGYLGGDGEIFPRSGESRNDLNSYLTMTSHSEGAAVSSFKETFTGTCDDSYSLTVTAGNASTTKILSSSCSGMNLSITVGFTHVEGSVESRSITITNGPETLVRTISFRYACPSGFIGVPGDDDMGTNDFCVAKYEMKAETNGGVDVEDGSGNNYSDCTSELLMADHVPESRASGRPWVCITQSEALNECNDMNGNGFTYRLISNEEWQSVARNAEEVNTNWMGGGVLKQGNNNGTCGSGDTDACYNGDNPAARDTDTNATAKLALSNGEEIWDLSGNVWEWTDMGGDQVVDDLDYTAGGALTWYELDEAYSIAVYPTIVDGTTSDSYSSIDFMPKLSTYPANYANSGFGRIRFATNPTGRAPLRSGDWSYGTDAGAFSAVMSSAPSDSGLNIGFRCSSSPALLNP